MLTINPGLDNAASALMDCTTRVLEGMFFASVFGEVDEAGLGHGPMVVADLSFTGPLQGSLAVAASPETAHALACSFLAHNGPDDLEPHRVQETMAELANIICGATLSQIDDEGLFTLAHPRARIEAFTTRSEGAIRRFLDVGDGSLVVSLTFEDEAS